MNRISLCVLMVIFGQANIAVSAEPAAIIDLWEKLAPGETTKNTGETLPRRENEHPPATRIEKITAPRMLRFDPPEERKNGTSLIILPGGGYRYVVVDKEGSEIAEWANQFGITAFVLQYRTSDQRSEESWVRPVQDTQRAARLIRAHADQWGLDAERIGVIGFSAGGNAAAIASTNFNMESFPVDQSDEFSSRPNFTMLIYPYRLAQENSLEIRDELPIDDQTPPAFLVHAHNDRITSLGSVAYYAQLKRRGIPAELHIYESGGHGYGMRPVSGSNIETWADRAEDWLRVRELIE